MSHTPEVPSEEQAQEAVRTLIRYIGDDPSREGLRDTPGRVIRSYKELFAGYGVQPREHLERKFSENCSEMILVRGIEFVSTCEHHMLPFIGTASIGYIPKDGAVVGLSKFARVVEGFARRLQIQERLTQEIADAIFSIGCAGVGVVVDSHHQCMSCRGVRQHNARMRTTVLLGNFLTDSTVRAEFLSSAM